MEVKEFDIEFPRGDTCPVNFMIIDYDGNVLIPSDTDELYFTVKKNYTSKKVILQKKLSNGDFFVDENGKISFILSHEETASLKYGSYNYDIQLVSGDYVKTVLLGTITLTNEATWIGDE